MKRSLILLLALTLALASCSDKSKKGSGENASTQDKIIWQQVLDASGQKGLIQTSAMKLSASQLTDLANQKDISPLLSNISESPTFFRPIGLAPNGDYLYLTPQCLFASNTNVDNPKPRCLVPTETLFTRAGRNMLLIYAGDPKKIFLAQGSSQNYWLLLDNNVLYNSADGATTKLPEGLSLLKADGESFYFSAYSEDHNSSDTNIIKYDPAKGTYTLLGKLPMGTTVCGDAAMMKDCYKFITSMSGPENCPDVGACPIASSTSVYKLEAGSTDIKALVDAGDIAAIADLQDPTKSTLTTQIRGTLYGYLRTSVVDGNLYFYGTSEDTADKQQLKRMAPDGSIVDLGVVETPINVGLLRIIRVAKDILFLLESTSATGNNYLFSISKGKLTKLTGMNDSSKFARIFSVDQGDPFSSDFSEVSPVLSRYFFFSKTPDTTEAAATKPALYLLDLDKAFEKDEIDLSDPNNGAYSLVTEYENCSDSVTGNTISYMRVWKNIAIYSFCGVSYYNKPFSANAEERKFVKVGDAWPIAFKTVVDFKPPETEGFSISDEGDNWTQKFECGTGEFQWWCKDGGRCLQSVGGPGKQCSNTCTTDEECVARSGTGARCVSSSCIHPNPSPECTTDADCSMNQSCSETYKTCGYSNIQCTTDNQCKKSNNSEDWKCLENMCKTTSNPCTSNEDCATYQDCHGEPMSCLASTTECTTKEQCERTNGGGGFNCSENICMPCELYQDLCVSKVQNITKNVVKIVGTDYYMYSLAWQGDSSIKFRIKTYFGDCSTVTSSSTALATSDTDKKIFNFPVYKPTAQTKSICVKIIPLALNNEVTTVQGSITIPHQ